LNEPSLELVPRDKFLDLKLGIGATTTFGLATTPLP
jgi:hypothetical protein